MTTHAERFAGCLLGLAAGDAVGTSVEFRPRGSFDPVTDMRGGGAFNLRAGEWTDDTSMALCLATSLVECGDFDARDQVRGNGYVVDSLEAALWCSASTDSFEAAILCAANLGDDADTTAAICGQLAGAFYGEAGIPAHWLERLAMCDAIRQLAVQLDREPA